MTGMAALTAVAAASLRMPHVFYRSDKRGQNRKAENDIPDVHLQQRLRLGTDGLDQSHSLTIGEVQ